MSVLAKGKESLGIRKRKENTKVPCMGHGTLGPILHPASGQITLYTKQKFLSALSERLFDAQSCLRMEDKKEERRRISPASFPAYDPYPSDVLHLLSYA